MRFIFFAVKALKCLLLILPILICIPVNASRQFYYGDLRYTILDEEKHTVETASGYLRSGSVRYSGNDARGNLIIPDTAYNEGVPYTVVRIGDYGFCQQNELKSVKLPNSLLEIGSEAFFRCEKLTDINFPDSLQIIKYSAFMYCWQLKGCLKIPDSMKLIEDQAFLSTKYEKIIFGNCKVKLGYYLFASDTLGVIDFGNAVIECVIAYSSGRPAPFNYCKLQNVVLGSSMEEIPDYLFSDSGLKSIAIPSSVKRIGDYAFQGCNLSQIEIPNTVEYIGSGAFAGNSFKSIELPTKINVIESSSFEDCHNLVSISIPNKVQAIEEYAFKGCEKLQIVTLSESLKKIGKDVFKNCKLLQINSLPESLDSIGEGAFFGCQEISIPKLPESLHYIGRSAFYGCKNLTISKLPASLEYIDNYVFYGCSLISISEIPRGITSIGDEAFGGCSGISSMLVPESVTYFGDKIFDGCTLQPLIIKSYSPSLKSSWNKTLEGLIYTSQIGTLYRNLGMMSLVDVSKKYSFDNPCIFGKIERKIARIDYSLEPNPDYDGPDDYNLYVGLKKDYRSEIENYKRIDDSNESKQLNTEPYSSKILVLGWNNNYEEKFSLETEPLYIMPNGTIDWESTQTTITINNLEWFKDETFTPESIGVSVNWQSYKFDSKPITIKNLSPDTSYDYYCYCTQGDQYYNTNLLGYVSTKPIIISPTVDECNPSSASLSFDLELGDANSESMFFDNELTDQTEFVVTGLDPQTNYCFPFSVKTSDGKEFDTSVSFTTPKLEITTLQPNSVSENCAIVAASTNLSDWETRAGFQWKKYDAPASLNPNEGFAGIYEGKLEGYLKNLQTTSYYKVRAFYKSCTDKYYYGEWVTFDPSDFSFFEPTVHTYNAYNVTACSATLKGYVMPGTETVVSQGFEYWIDGQPHTATRTISADNEKNIIQLDNSQIMAVTLTDLLPSTSYLFKAFVTTDAGTKYGEENAFTTDEESGIVEIADEYISIVGYYDMLGSYSKEPFKGINIVVYSNGETSKIMIR